jgi:hypothetical protein
MLQIELKKAYEAEKLAAQAELDATTRAQEEAVKQAEADMQTLLDQIQTAKLERAKKEDDAKIATEKALAAIEKDKQDAYAKTVAAIMDSITPELVSAMTSKSNADMLSAVSESMAPYALSKNESIADVTNKLLRGTTLEGIIDNIGTFKIPE